MSFINRARSGWDVFRNREALTNEYQDVGPTIIYDQGPSRSRGFMNSEQSILASIHTRIGIDASEIDIFHVRLDDDDQYLTKIESGLQTCLTVEANLDQAATAFKRDMIMTLLEVGVVAVVPVLTSTKPLNTGGYDIYTLRAGKIVDWYPQHVRVSLYDEARGLNEELLLAKSMVAIIENPLYAVMNEPNSTYQRLIRKLNLLDVIDEQSSSGKLDIIVSLPYMIKNETKRIDASRRIRDVELQMRNSKYGIAYLDANEKITQLNRPSENNMLKQVEYLTAMLYGQLGITTAVLDGTASELELLNYYNRTTKPIVKSIVEEFQRKFLSKTARSQKQAIMYMIDPFKNSPITKIAEMAETFSRNEILSSNELRGQLGRRPSTDPKADMLLNKNMPVVPDPENSETVDINTEEIAFKPGSRSAEEFIAKHSSIKNYRKT